MKKIWLFLLGIIVVSCTQNKHITVEYLDTKENVIIGLLERDINEEPNWNLKIDSIEFFIKEYKRSGNVFIGEVYGTAYDWYDYSTLDYHNDYFISHFEIWEVWEDPKWVYVFDSEDVVRNLDTIEEIKRFKY